MASFASAANFSAFSAARRRRVISVMVTVAISVTANPRSRRVG